MTAVVHYASSTSSLNVWVPIPPPGYVALGHLVTTSSAVPSGDEIWCLRRDLVGPGKFEERSTWDSWGGHIPRPMNSWRILRRTDGDYRTESQLPVNPGTFWFTIDTWDPPNASDAWVPLLPIGPDLTVPGPLRPPELSANEIPTTGALLNEIPTNIVHIPRLAVFEPPDTRCMDIDKPFISLTTFRGWEVVGVFENQSDNMSDLAVQSYTDCGPRSGPQPHSSQSLGILDLDPDLDSDLDLPGVPLDIYPPGFKLYPSGFRFNSALGIDRTRDLLKGQLENVFPIPPRTVMISWRQRLRVEVRLGGVDGPVFDTGIHPFYVWCPDQGRRLPITQISLPPAV